MTYNMESGVHDEPKKPEGEAEKPKLSPEDDKIAEVAKTIRNNEGLIRQLGLMPKTKRRLADIAQARAENQALAEMKQRLQNEKFAVAKTTNPITKQAKIIPTPPAEDIDAFSEAMLRSGNR